MAEHSTDVNKTVHVSHLPNYITEQHLIDLFSPCGPISYIRVLGEESPQCTQSKFAFIEFMEVGGYTAAFNLSGMLLGDKQIQVNRSHNGCAKPYPKTTPDVKNRLKAVLEMIGQKIERMPSPPPPKKRERERSTSESHSRKRREASKDRDRKRRSRDRSRDRDRHRDGDRRRSRDRSRRSRDRAKERRRSRDRDRGRDKERRSRDRSREKTRPKDRDRSAEREKKDEKGASGGHDSSRKEDSSPDKQNGHQADRRPSVSAASASPTRE
eukprot:GGOE01027318.1.p1 GENE.GGOE01027318.1~~GGOE01027318.1.p1  ORF type:complete len:279 (-),score=49.85 GGOE01027318.1:249-1055(-)